MPVTAVRQSKQCHGDNFAQEHENMPEMTNTGQLSHPVLFKIVSGVPKWAGPKSQAGLLCVTVPQPRLRH